jgi:hydroxyethylthiazole kinase-like uncharacterized protein yjeF
MQTWRHPVLSPAQSLAFEKAYFSGDKNAEESAMQLAGSKLGQAVASEFGRIFKIRTQGLLVLGKGHNAGDAINACFVLLDRFEDLSFRVIVPFGLDSMNVEIRFLVDELLARREVELSTIEEVGSLRFGVSIDGVFGMQFRPPLSDALQNLFRKINDLDILCRVAVDIPSGLSDGSTQDCLQADVTYATGILKSPLIPHDHRGICGRIRYIDIGFFDASFSGLRKPEDWVYVPRRMELSASLRPAKSDKRSYGHLLIVAGSRAMPGAMLMAVKAAVRSGVGLVSVMTPASVVPTVAPEVPEAMWIPWDETEEGYLSLEGASKLLGMVDKFEGILLGPGTGKHPETKAFLSAIIETLDGSYVLDADALLQEHVDHLRKKGCPFVLTPHWGEFNRISGISEKDNSRILDFCADRKMVLVLKDSLTQIYAGGEATVVPCGNPLLARGGSGDILAGLVGGHLAKNDGSDLTKAVADAVFLHGCAADELASIKGEHYVATTDILPYVNALH